jgi:hypothetical protein
VLSEGLKSRGLGSGLGYALFLLGEGGIESDCDSDSDSDSQDSIPLEEASNPTLEDLISIMEDLIDIKQMLGSNEEEFDTDEEGSCPVEETLPRRNSV